MIREDSGYIPEPECLGCDEEFDNIRMHWRFSDCDNPYEISCNSLALFSGGHDSLVSTHYCMENGETDAVLHLDTGTGIPENKEYVKDVCREYDWDLYIRSAEKTLKEFAIEWGFPKPSSHSWAYRYFKYHVLGSVASDIYCGTPEFYTGVRKEESDRRMDTITSKRQEEKNWVWVAPIMDWTKEDCEQYIRENGLPRNPVVENIHRSGECFCGAFGTRDEELIDLEAHYPDHAEWLLNVEEEVQEEIGTEEDYCWWGIGGMDSRETKALIEEGDHGGLVLCQDCVSQQEQERRIDDW